MSASPTEITRDIVVALIQAQDSALGRGLPEAAVKGVADAFDKIHATVLKNWQDE